MKKNLYSDLRTEALQYQLSFKVQLTLVKILQGTILMRSNKQVHRQKAPQSLFMRRFPRVLSYLQDLSMKLK